MSINSVVLSSEEQKFLEDFLRVDPEEVKKKNWRSLRVIISILSIIFIIQFILVLKRAYWHGKLYIEANGDSASMINTIQHAISNSSESIIVFLCFTFISIFGLWLLISNIKEVPTPEFPGGEGFEEEGRLSIDWEGNSNTGLNYLQLGSNRVEMPARWILEAKRNENKWIASNGDSEDTLTGKFRYYKTPKGVSMILNMELDKNVFSVSEDVDKGLPIHYIGLSAGGILLHGSKKYEKIYN